MRFRVPAAVVISVVTAGLGVAGCQSSTSASAQPTPAPSHAASQAAGSGKGGVTRCRTAQLSAWLDGKGPIQDVNNRRIVRLDNTGSAPCTLYGYPGVTLVGTVGGHKGYQWPLRHDSSVKPTVVTLGPNDTAYFTIGYLPWGKDTAGQKISVYEIVITAPGDRAQTRVAWDKDLLLQDSATRPGTWIQPVQEGEGY